MRKGMNIPKRYSMSKIALIFIVLLVNPNINAQTTSESLVQKIDSENYKIGNVRFSVTDQCIKIPANINMKKGLIEVLLSGKMGKLHESLLVTDCSPLHLQLALLTLGFQCINNPDTTERVTKSDSFLVYIEWNSDNKTEILRAERLIWNEATKKEMDPTYWDFIGSPIYSDGRLVAEFEHTLIATYRMPTILENKLPTKFDDTLYYVNENVVPPVGTEVTVIIEPLIKPGEK